MKQRFSSLDVKVIAHELSAALCTLRLTNVYDLSSRIFLVKFNKPGSRQQIIVESGFRCHLTNFARTTAAAPSAFVARLRRYLKTRRVTSVSQVGTDRIIEIQFSDGQYRLYLEFYAGGNVVLTDNELNIIALLRMVSEGQDQEELRVGLKYSLENRQNYGGTPALTKERVRSGLQKSVDRAPAESGAPGKKSKKKSGDALRKALATSVTEFPPMLIDHALRVKSFDPGTPVEDVLKDESKLDSLMDVLEEAKAVVESITASETSKGYIVAKPAKSRASTQPEQVDGDDGEVNKENVGILYEDFHPFRPQQFADSPDLTFFEFDGFNKTVDEFFSSLESQKLESRLTEREENAKRKLEAARLDHEKRLGGLQQVQGLNVRKAQAIEGNLQRVQEATAAVNGLIAQGMDWVEIARLIEMEQARQNPVAELIKLPLKLYENTITLLLAEESFEDEDYDEADETDSDVSGTDDEDDRILKTAAPKLTDKRLSVDIDLALSPWSNARQFYEQKKTAAVKEQKTLQSSAMALKSTEKKITADLKKGLSQEKELLRPVRNQLWFEKFYYFISSEGYLVLGGRDIQQNEILYKRYLSKGDAYVHADLQGATSVIAKNKPGLADAPIPPSTLSQAGSFSVATSIAWDSKAVMAAWWVKADQVSKMASNGEYMGIGAFDIRGTKNYLPPAQLLLGFGVMFRISERSIARHLKHRVPAGQVMQDEGAKSLTSKHLITTEESSEELSDVEQDQKWPTQDSESDDDREDGQYVNPLQASQGSTEPLEPQGNGSLHDSPAPHVDVTAKDEADEPSTNNDNDNDNNNDSDSDSDNDSDNDSSDKATREEEIKAEAVQLEASSTGTSSAQKSSTETRPAVSKKTVQAPQVRGKHGKKSKLKTKYAHQDEEDRALALRVLGSTKSQQKTQSEAEAKAVRETQMAADKARRREQHLRTQQSGKESEERRRQKLEEGAEQLDEDEVAELSMLDYFVGTPLPGDEILDCLVVCAPWDAIGARFRWRVKIQPGSLKKGKAIKEILGAWAKSIADREKKRMPAAEDERYAEERMLKREGDLVKALRDVEVVGIVPVGKCRVMMSGSGGGGEKGKGGEGKGGSKGNRGGRGSKRGR